MRYHLQSVEKNNPDSLFEFYNNYEKYCSEKYQKFFQDEPYKSMVAQPKKYFLELAALSGNIDAQYAFAEDLLLEVIALAEEITTEQDPQEKQLKENRLEILKKRREFFLENAAKNNHYEAQVKFAQSIELGYKKDNHSMPNCIIREDPGLAFYYYNKASKQNEAARKKVLEIVNSITSKDAKETTEKDFLFLKATFKYHPFLSLRYAICLESGYGTKQNKKLAAEIFETIDKNEGTDLYRRLLLATHYLSNNNSKLFKDLVGNTENGEALFAGIINLIKEQYIIALETKLDIFNNYCQKYHSVKDKNLQLITGVLNAIKTANDSSRKSLAKSSAIDFLETHAKPNPELPEEISKQCQEIILQLATSGIIKINPKEFKKFKDWRGENILKVLRLIYNAGIKIEKESERNKYIKEFQHHIQNNRDDENLIIKLKAENYPGNWIVDPKIEQQALEARRREEEEARRREEEARRKLAEEARIKEEKTRRKLAEEARIREEEARRREEEARRKLAEEARIREEEARRKADEEARAQEEEKARKQQMEEFLENRNPIKSIESLPEYVQYIVRKCR